jgi:DNA-binding FrmR family transcriptional regulator
MADERGCCGSAQGRVKETGLGGVAEGPLPERTAGAEKERVGVERSPEERTRLLARLRRAEGQVAAIRRMVEENAYCVDVLVQIAAVRGALGRVGEEVLQHHVETCVTEAFRAGDPTARQVKIDELMEVFARYGGFGRGQ